MADRDKAVFDYTERSIAEDHTRHVDVTPQATDQAASGAPLNARPQWSNTREVALAQQVRSWIDREEHLNVAGSAPLRAPHEEVAHVWPDAKRWGTDVLVAAVQPTHAEKCRWLAVIHGTRAAMNHRVHGGSAPVKLPTFSKAMIQLLGVPCLGCVKKLRGMAKGRVDSGRAGQNASAGQGRHAASGVRGAPLYNIRGASKGAVVFDSVTASGAGGVSCDCVTFRSTDGRTHWRGCATRRGR